MAVDLWESRVVGVMKLVVGFGRITASKFEDQGTAIIQFGEFGAAIA